MERKPAIYARKSVFREDSISIGSQIETCRYETRGQEHLVYQDNGYSGKNTDRPGFQRMVTDIKAGLISKVIVYKLDRVSRSVLDFSGLMDLLGRYNVDFISATEHFDTSDPIGRAMLNICVVFAQLERETIQQRVVDAYASRSKRGFYMGGRLPYGFGKEPLTIDGVRTSAYVQEPDEAADISLIYELYSRPSATLGDVMRELEAKGHGKNRRGRHWNTARLSEIMSNPIYTTNDICIYEFFKAQGSNMINPPEEFDGVTSQYLFSGANTNRKTWDLTGQNIVIAPHRGFIPPDIWLACRRKLLGNHQVRTCKAKNSFLAGRIKCGNCGYAAVVRFSQRSKGQTGYFIDTGRTENHCCAHKLPTIRADEFENIIIDRIRAKLSELTIRADTNVKDELLEMIGNTEARILKIEQEIEALVDKIALPDIDKTTVRYVNERIAKLDGQKTELSREADRLRADRRKRIGTDKKVLHNVMDKWNELSFEDKRSVTELLIEKILLFPDRIEIRWRA